MQVHDDIRRIECRNRECLVHGTALVLIGYAWVSTDDQNLSLQQDTLREAGCERIFEDQLSGAKSDRPGLPEALEDMHERAMSWLSGDWIAWNQSLDDLIEMAVRLETLGIGLKNLHKSINTSSNTGKLTCCPACRKHEHDMALDCYGPALIREKTLRRKTQDDRDAVARHLKGT